MKYSIAWHKECLSNEIRSLQRMKEEKENYIQSIDNKIERLEEDIKLRSYQIKEAEKEGKMAFDPDRFKISKNK